MLHSFNKVIPQPLSNIYKIQEIAKIKEHITPKTWLILDLDQTVMQMAQSAGSDPWIRAMLDSAKSETEATASLELYHKLQDRSGVELAEECTANLIKELQGEGYNILALTSRSKRLVNTTPRQLGTLNISFNHGAFKDRNLQLNVSTDSCVSDGIIFCNGANKATCLREFLTRAKHDPKHLVFIDDNIKHIEHLAQFTKESGIEFVGLHYTRLHFQHNDLHWPTINKQLEIFNDGHGELLSDEEARALVNGKGIRRVFSAS